MGRLSHSLCRAAALLAAASIGCTEKPPSEETGAPAAGAARPGAEKAGEEPVRREVRADDPRSVFGGAQDAMKRRDFGALFDLLSGSARDNFYADLRADAQKAAGAAFVRDVLGYDPAEASRLPPREAFVKVMEGGARVSDRLAAGVGFEGPAGGEVVPRIAQAKVVDVETEGDTATLSVEHEDGSQTEVLLVREDGAWKLAEMP